MSALIDLRGKVFGKLLVIDRALKNSGNNQPRWIVWCSCGSEPFEAIGYNLKTGSIKSCGCYRRARARRLTYKHGHTAHKSNSPTYRTWRSMKERCQYDIRYRSRDITVCERWVAEFTAFLEDMGERPEGHSLDRIDSSKGYAPDNCRWATAKQQAANRCSTISKQCLKSL